eukprot:527457-Rhodomonas_salina.2
MRSRQRLCASGRVTSGSREDERPGKDMRLLEDQRASAIAASRGKMVCPRPRDRARTRMARDGIKTKQRPPQLHAQNPRPAPPDSARMGLGVTFPFLFFSFGFGAQVGPRADLESV